ncbi:MULTISPECIES: DUF1572 family protein [Flavobacterium]|uniref:DUF1572 domain-containing protein n=1 Tax=Flavobacterium columnare TaxID=996 RepID=A0AA94JN58_9FLAO|nr:MULTISPECIES: DUF1572 family protein [Flavobacterium]MCH4830557.1 DUF1572 domain-containing protein [Flavobacterium columnare]MCH4833506.1 DUF1572 domain-containing protein [Flavobacterium columnare]QYS91127.1 DUF1572 domain-containing protein [Flavobacterium covae]
MENTNLYLESVKKQMFYYKTIAEKAIDQLNSEQLFVMSNEDTNSIAVILQHIAGNMLSRWTDFLTSDGEKEWRDRDAEFENKIMTKEELLVLWEKGWKCFFDAINDLKPQNLSQIIYIRNEEQTVIDAINRQLAHYPYHIGQIVFYAKMLKNKTWNSLSILKNQSKEYNNIKFSKENNL